MQTALLANGQVIQAKDYIPDVHGVRLFCIDQSCRVPVIYVQGNQNTVPFFKTTGKGDSIHKESCGFFRKLSFQETLKKVTEYQQNLQGKGIKEVVVRMNLHTLDPDYQKKTVHRETKEKTDDPSKVKVKNENDTPQTISSLRSVTKLFTYEPDILAGIIVSIQGKKIPISELIRSYEDSHRALWSDELNKNLPYFIHGKIEKVIRREKVWYFNFPIIEDNHYFSLVVFDSHFKYFSYKDEDLLGKEILAYGFLRKNSYREGKFSTEMIIKSDKFIDFIN